MTLCLTCGNEVDPGIEQCRFCHSEIVHENLPQDIPFVLHRRINLKYGRPLVEAALKRFKSELSLAKGQHVRVLTVIHGYGSSGKGGRIRVECRKLLDYLMQTGELKSCIAGEAFHKRTGSGKALIRQYPELETICASDINNPGVTIVVL